jgi:hypothetical protein
MFGLMRSRSCSLTPEQKLNRRLHYCGTCKTMGRLYGQRTRFLLNNDAVFLAELLSAISGEDSQIGDWDRTYQSYNCLSLPPTSEAMPLPLQYAAAGALAIADFKIADQIADSGRFPWGVAASAFSKSFRRASATLGEWNFPVRELKACSLEQSAREQACGVTADDRFADDRYSGDRYSGDRYSGDRYSGDRYSGEILAYLEQPTGDATALFFGHGARLVGRPELRQAMREIGFKLGSLIYLLDAYEDYDKDSRAGAFNALKAAYQISEERLSARYREMAGQRIWRMATEVEAGLMELPISAERAQVFAGRLRSNLAHRLGRRLPVLQRSAAVGTQRTVCSCGGAPIGFSARWRGALQLGRSIVDKRRRERPGAFAFSFEAPFVFLSVMAVAMLFPRQARTVGSYRECIGIAFNLMFVTALLRSLVAAPFRHVLFSSQVPPGQGEPLPGQPPGPAPGVGPVLQYTVGPPGEPVPPPQPPPKQGCSFCCCDSDCGDCCDCCDCCSGCDC